MSEQAQPLISDNVKRYTLGVLVVVYTFNFIDRQILSILIEPIKADLDVTDFGMGPKKNFGTHFSSTAVASKSNFRAMFFSRVPPEIFQKLFPKLCRILGTCGFPFSSAHGAQ